MERVNVTRLLAADRAEKAFNEVAQKLLDSGITPEIVELGLEKAYGELRKVKISVYASVIEQLDNGSGEKEYLHGSLEEVEKEMDKNLVDVKRKKGKQKNG